MSIFGVVILAGMASTMLEAAALRAGAALPTPMAAPRAIIADLVRQT